MKKLLAVIMVLGLTASSVFAEITWGGGGRLIFIPFGIRFANDDATAKDSGVATYFGAENPWSNGGVRLGLSLTGSRPEGNMGFNISFVMEGGTPTIDDCAGNLWIKPFGGIFETFKFTFGIFNVDNLRFKFAGAGSSFHNYIWYVRGDMTNEDDTFSRFHSSGFGSHLAWEPIKGLWLAWGVGSVGDSRVFRGEFKEDGWLNALTSSQFAVGYTIQDIGLVRAQFMGPVPKEWGEIKAGSWAFNSTTNMGVYTPPEYGYVNAIDALRAGTGNNPGEAMKIQAAFNLTAVQGLNIDIGGSIPIVYERDYWNDENKASFKETIKTQEDFVISLGFDLTIFNPFRLWGLTSVKLGGYRETTPAAGDSVKVNRGTDFAIHLSPMYTVAPNNIVGLDLFLDVRTGSDEKVSSLDTLTPGRDTDPTLKPDADAKNNYLDLGFGVYYRRNIAGGDIRAGVTMKLPGGEGHKGAQPQLYIPIMFNYNF